jgi:hypothetical protein
MNVFCIIIVIFYAKMLENMLHSRDEYTSVLYFIIRVGFWAILVFQVLCSNGATNAKIIFTARARIFRYCIAKIQPVKVV